MRPADAGACVHSFGDTPAVCNTVRQGFWLLHLIDRQTGARASVLVLKPAAQLRVQIATGTGCSWYEYVTMFGYGAAAGYVYPGRATIGLGAQHLVVAGASVSDPSTNGVLFTSPFLAYADPATAAPGMGFELYFSGTDAQVTPLPGEAGTRLMRKWLVRIGVGLMCVGVQGGPWPCTASRSRGPLRPCRRSRGSARRRVRSARSRCGARDANHWHYGGARHSEAGYGRQ